MDHLPAAAAPPQDTSDDAVADDIKSGRKPSNRAKERRSNPDAMLRTLEGAPMEKADDEQARRLAEARAALLAGLGLTLERAQRLGIDVAHLDAIVAQGLSLKEAIDRGLLVIPPEVAGELMGESIQNLQQHAAANGLDCMTDEEIEDEINAARASRPDQPR